MQEILTISKQKILITGGAGFIGGALIARLLEKTQAIVINIDKLGYASDLDRINQIIKNYRIPINRYKFICADLLDKDKIADLVSEISPDIIVHLAAESHVDRSIISPINFLESNVIGTFNLLEATRFYFQKLSRSNKSSFRFLHVSTDEVYGSLGPEGLFNEESAYNPRSPYASSKAASDHFVQAFFHTYDLPILITNCSNNYGPWQFPEKLIPVIISRAISQQDIPIYGDGLNIRDWIYVDDHIEALLLVLKKGILGNSYCIGANEEHQNIEIAQMICDLLDQIQPCEISYSSLIRSVKDRAGHDKRYAIDSTKIRKNLGWFPENNFSVALKKTVNWYLSNQDWCKKLSI